MSGPVDALACTYCGNELKGEEVESPEHDGDGDVLCDGCYDEHFRDYCGRCDEKVDSADLDTSPGQLIGIWSEAPAAGSDDLAPGYYRVKRRPFFADGMITGHFYSNSLEFVAPLDDAGNRRAAEGGCLSGPLCSECRAALTNVGGAK